MANIDQTLDDLSKRIKIIEKKIDLILKHLKIEVSKEPDPLPYIQAKIFEPPRK